MSVLIYSNPYLTAYWFRKTSNSLFSFNPDLSHCLRLTEAAEPLQVAYVSQNWESSCITRSSVFNRMKFSYRNKRQYWEINRITHNRNRYRVYINEYFIPSVLEWTLELRLERMNIATVKCTYPIEGQDTLIQLRVLVDYWFGIPRKTARLKWVRTRLDRIPFQASAQVFLASTDLHSFSHRNRRMNQTDFIDYSFGFGSAITVWINIWIINPIN